MRSVIDDYLIGREEDSTVVRLLCSGVPEDDEWSAHFSQARIRHGAGTGATAGPG